MKEQRTDLSTQASRRTKNNNSSSKDRPKIHAEASSTRDAMNSKAMPPTSSLESSNAKATWKAYFFLTMKFPSHSVSEPRDCSTEIWPSSTASCSCTMIIGRADISSLGLNYQLWAGLIYMRSAWGGEKWRAGRTRNSMKTKIMGHSNRK